MAATSRKKRPAPVKDPVIAPTTPPAPEAPVDRPDDSPAEAPRRSAPHVPGLPVSRALPRTFQGRLSLAFVMVFALAVGIVSILTVFVLDNDLRQQEETNLEARANAVAAVVRVKAEATAAAEPGQRHRRLGQRRT